MVAEPEAEVDHLGADRYALSCHEEAVDYGAVATHLGKTRDLGSVEIQTEFHSTWLDNSKARSLLGWRPKVDLPESAGTAVRRARDAR